MIDYLTEFLLPPQRSTSAADVDALFHFINITGFILLLGITITIIYFIIKYRRRSEDEVTPVIKHNTKLELTWSVIPVILILIVFSWGFRGFLDLNTPPENAYEINVTAFSWSWQFDYPGEGMTNELVVPKDTPVKLTMRSDDVLHSFYVPDFRVKADVLPNRYTTVWFEATETGETHVFCAEYCGAEHSTMLADVRIVEQDEFDRWLEEDLGIDEDLPLVEVGEQTFERQGCQQCHSLDGTPGQGPSLQGLFGSQVELEDGTTLTADEDYIRRSLTSPQEEITAGFPPIMPAYAHLSDREIDGLIEFIKEQQ